MIYEAKIWYVDFTNKAKDLEYRGNKYTRDICLDITCPDVKMFNPPPPQAKISLEHKKFFGPKIFSDSKLFGHKKKFRTPNFLIHNFFV